MAVVGAIIEVSHNKHLLSDRSTRYALSAAVDAKRQASKKLTIKRQALIHKRLKALQTEATKKDKTVVGKIYETG